ncbi:MAG: PIN domain nuclease [Solirubrobacterales bacterium]|nr:PIN domain nuclease [Solirubrobacterales bacterium]
MLLLDNSAWSRRDRPGAREILMDRMRRGELAACIPFLLEAGYSARSAGELKALVTDLALLPRVEIGPDVERIALLAQSELAARGQHRMAAPADLLIAACAHHSGHGVLHYDRDYDGIREHTSLEFASEWVAPAGSLR